MADHRPHTRHVDASSPQHPSSFTELGVPQQLCDALAKTGVTAPFPIQSLTLPDALAGRDVLGRGRTGSGKTLAFVLPVVSRLATDAQPARPRRPRALILAPTRELVRQIHGSLDLLARPAGLTTTTVFGGVPAGPQIAAFRRGVHIVVACPGRLEDLIGSGHVELSEVEVTVLDEADHMADLGFLPTVTRLLGQTSRSGQRLFFSATLDNAVDTLVKRFLHQPVVHHAPADEASVGEMDHHVLHVSQGDRLRVLVDLTSAPGRSVVFTRTKHRSRQLTRQLVAAGVPAVEMHGNLSQSVRIRNLAAFTDGRATTLVATDIAARGIHVDDVALVIHADPPVEHKSYLHRSGRTARAGAAGTVITLATEEQRRDVTALSRKAGISPRVAAVRPDDALLNELAPGPRIQRDPAEIASALSGPASRPPATRSPRKPSGNAAAGRRRRDRPATGGTSTARRPRRVS